VACNGGVSIENLVDAENRQQAASHKSRIILKTISATRATSRY
jgi:hypothetical protein